MKNDKETRNERTRNCSSHGKQGGHVDPFERIPRISSVGLKGSGAGTGELTKRSSIFPLRVKITAISSRTTPLNSVPLLKNNNKKNGKKKRKKSDTGNK